MMHTGGCLLMGLLLGGPPAKTNAKAGVVNNQRPAAPNTIQTIATLPLTRLGGPGQIFWNAPQSAIAQAWCARLRRFDLPAKITRPDCVHSAVPNGHRFYLLIVPASNIRGKPGASPIRVTLHWEENDYAAVGWRVLAALKEKPLRPNGAEKNSGKKK